MKKIIFLFIFTMMSQFVFSQSEIMRFLSMGFNAKYEQRGNRSYYDYFFYGYDNYSEAFISSNGVEFRIGEMTFYPNGRIVYIFPPFEYSRYSGQNSSIGYERYINTQGFYGEEHKFENDRLVYWALTGNKSPYTNSVKIEQNIQNIIIYFKVDEIDEIIFQHRYYNISRIELLDMFLKKYIELICSMNEFVNDNTLDDFLYEIITPVFQGRTARELEIFRNCLYAIKGYRFSNSSWTDFFNKYLEGYSARYSNAEVTAMFSDNEKWLLDLVIGYENRR